MTNTTIHPVKAARAACGLTVRDTVRLTSLSNATITAAEYGRKVPQARTRRLLAAAFDMPEALLWPDLPASGQQRGVGGRLLPEDRLSKVGNR